MSFSPGFNRVMGRGDQICLNRYNGFPMEARSQGMMHRRLRLFFIDSVSWSTIFWGSQQTEVLPQNLPSLTKNLIRFVNL